MKTWVFSNRRVKFKVTGLIKWEFEYTLFAFQDELVDRLLLDLENFGYEKEEAEGEMKEMQNSYWYADEEGDMVMLRGRKGIY
jgi:hypothetical protein